MDKVEKQETLSKLYTLRAGLSIIAQEKDEVENILQRRLEKVGQLSDILKSEEEKFQDAKNRAAANESYLRGRIKNEKSKIKLQKSEIKELECDTQKTSNAKENLASTRIYFRCLIGIIIGIAIMVGLGVNEFANPANDTFSFVLVGIFFAIGAIITIICLIKILNVVRGKSKKIKGNISAIQKKESEISKNIQHITQIKKELESVLAKNAENQIVLQNRVNEVNKAVKLASVLTNVIAVKTLNTHKATAVGIYNSLSEEYSELLDERDWQYVDLFIYMYETGRADSKKEALQLIDQYQQNKSIEEAIARAGREIQGSIRQGLGALQTSMERQFKALSGQLYQMHSETMLKMDRITNQLDNLNSEMSRLSMDMSQMSSGLEGMQQQLNLNTALQAKANVSSQQLMEDVKYMRTLDEQAEIRRRNGLNSYGQYS